MTPSEKQHEFRLGAIITVSVLYRLASFLSHMVKTWGQSLFSGNDGCLLFLFSQVCREGDSGMWKLGGFILFIDVVLLSSVGYRDLLGSGAG